MSVHNRNSGDRVLRIAAFAMLFIGVWLAIMLSAAMLNRSNSVVIFGDDAQIRRAIILSRARIAGKKGSLLLVKRTAPDLAADLVDHGAGFVLPDVFFDAF